MSLNSIFQFLVPKDKKFSPLFVAAASNLVELASHLHEAVNLPLKEREVLFKKIDELEQRGEDITRQTLLELSRNFITPFDREDIHALITSIDNVADNLQGAASRMRLYHLDKITKSIRKLTEINLEACQNIELAIIEIKDIKEVKNINKYCFEISKLENKSDDVYNKAIFEIFENETDAITIIKYKEVLSVLESATDKCKSVAGVLESIAVKHS
jgi:predicted phosphate transport protein (TIGR00153 family)